MALLCPAFLLTKTAAITCYVDVNSANPIPPYTNWATAAAVIQDAVDVAGFGSLVLVTNGVYRNGGRALGGMSNRVFFGSPQTTIQSVNGPVATSIEGYQVPGTTNGPDAVRCVWLNSDCSLVGFTLTNGATLGEGGGIYGPPTSALVSNCVIVGNSAAGAGGGVYRVRLFDCNLIGNTAYGNGGGASSSQLIRCLVQGNSAANGGGVSVSGLTFCRVLNNSALLGPSGHAGGGAYSASAMTNCLVAGNSANQGGGAFGGWQYNCTIVSNWASFGGGLAGFSPASSQPYLSNNIVYYNNATNGPDCYGPPDALDFCCTPITSPGRTIITNAPRFIDPVSGDFRLAPDSPCINSGRNASVRTTTDLDGNPRISGGTVDLGAYEFQNPASTLSYAWLQQYGLATDGSADSADSDGDGMNNWKEWIAGTDPTIALSVLRVLPLGATNNSSGVNVAWESVAGRHYFLERSTNLAVNPMFQVLAPDVFAQTNTIGYQDSTAIGVGPFFYRVGVSR